MSPSSASPSSRSGSESESGSAAKRSASVTLSSGISTSADELGERGRAAELELEPGPGLLQAGQGVAGVDGQADGAARVGDAAGDGLADPPRGVGGELEALAPVELLDGVHQAEVALLDEVEQRQARRLVLLGDRDHEAQVGLHERALGVVALADGARELALAGGGEILPAASSSVRAAAPASMAWASRTSSSLVSSGYCPMSVRYRRTRSSSSRSTRSLAKTNLVNAGSGSRGPASPTAPQLSTRDPRRLMGLSLGYRPGQVPPPEGR